MYQRLNISKESLVEFCQKWKIDKLSVFGSILRDDFNSESDIDFLVTFKRDADWSLFDHVGMREELQNLIGRQVDLLTEKALANSGNWIRQKEIQETASQIYPVMESVYVA